MRTKESRGWRVRQVAASVPLVAALVAVLGWATPAWAECTSVEAVSCAAPVSGDTTGGQADTDAWGCLAWELFGPEQSHEFVATTTGDVYVQLSPVAGFDAALIVLDGACDPASDCLRAIDESAAGAPEGVRLAVTAGETLHFVVDGFDDGGAYTLRVVCGAPTSEIVCADAVDDDGDGQTDCDDDDCAAHVTCAPAELVCDDGVDDDGDGATDCDDDDCLVDPVCGAFEIDCGDGVDDDGDGDTDCADDDCFEYPECAAAVCTAATVVGCDETRDADTTALAALMDAYACGATPYTGSEYVMAVDPDVPSIVTVRVTPVPGGLDPALVLLEGTCAPETCVVLRDYFPANFPEELQFVAVPGEERYVVVDGYDGSVGAFSVEVTCRPPETEIDCANGRDDDGDGPADCEDDDCAGDAACASCDNDEFEPNDGLGGASDVAPGALAGLVLVDGEDEDWFGFEVCAGAWVTVDAIFAHDDGDIDLSLVDAAGEVIVASTSVNDNEHVEHLATADSTLYAAVTGREADCTPYDLVVAVDETGCGGVTEEGDCTDGVDADGDGATDCDDDDCADDAACATVTEETDCTDGVDEDGDGATDCDDDDCADDAACATVTEETDCTDAVDEDGDGATDCDDDDCDDDAACAAVTEETDCTDAVDEDGDGATDCDDDDCADDAACAAVTEETDCTDGVDEDGDGATDCDDDDCAADAACAAVTEETDCTDGVDEDGDGATDCDDDDCAADAACAAVTEETDCTDAVDEDGDGATDCADDDCADAPACAPVAEPTPDAGGGDEDVQEPKDDVVTPAEDVQAGPDGIPVEDDTAGGGDDTAGGGTSGSGGDSSGCAATPTTAPAPAPLLLLLLLAGLLFAVRRRRRA